MKTAEQILKSKVKHIMTMTDAKNIISAMEEYAQQFASQPNQLKQVEEWDKVRERWMEECVPRENAEDVIVSFFDYLKQHYSAPKDSGKELSEITDEDKWIDVRTILPQIGVLVKVKIGCSGMGETKYSESQATVDKNGRFSKGFDWCHVTHWQPLPAK